MPFRFRKTLRLGPLHFEVGRRGVTSIGLGRTTFRRGHTPRVSVPLFGGLSWFFGGKRKRRRR